MASKKEPNENSDKQGVNRRTLLKGGAIGAGAIIGTGAPGIRNALAGLKKKQALQVPRRVLGKTGKKVPILLFGGAVDLDPKFDPKLATAYRYGVDYIDAARMYGGGTCEPAVGNFLERSKLRDKVWITTKSERHEAKAFRADVDKSLKDLKTKYIDLYFMHSLYDAKYLNKDMEKTAAALKKEGKIRHFGFSCHKGNVAELLNAAAKLPWIDVVMFRYNFRTYGEKELNKAIDAAHKANIGLIAMKTQGAAASFEDKWKKFSGKYSKHQAVLKAVWADKRIAAAVSHMDSLEILKENVAAALDKKQLGAVELEELKQYAAATRGLACDGCDHLCNPQVGGPVQIGDTMRFLMYHDVYGEQDKAKRLFSSLPEGAKRLGDYDFSGANSACPHAIDVAGHMKRALKILI